MAKEILFEAYRNEMEKIKRKVSDKLIKKKTIILKNIGHSLIRERTVYGHDYIGQICELTEYLKRMEVEAEQIFDFYSLAVNGEGNCEKDVLIRDDVIGSIRKEHKQLVNLKRAITTLEHVC